MNDYKAIPTCSANAGSCFVSLLLLWIADERLHWPLPQTQLKHLALAKTINLLHQRQ